MNGIKGIILDYGGTLDTGGDHWSKVIQDGWNKAGVVADDALFREAYVYGEQELERTLHILPHHNFHDLLLIKLQIELGYLAQNGHFPPAMVDEKAQEIASYCYEIARNNVVKSKQVLEQLSQKYPLVLVSNFYGNLESVLTDFGIRNCFKKVIESASVGERKPDTKIFEIALKALGLKAEEVLVVGDSIKNDIEPAKKLGCATLLITGRGWDENSPVSQAGEAIKNLDEIFNFLEGIGKV